VTVANARPSRNWHVETHPRSRRSAGHRRRQRRGCRGMAPQWGATAETEAIEGPAAPTSSAPSFPVPAAGCRRHVADARVIGRLGGVGARPQRLGLVSDGDGAVVALAAAAALARARSKGDSLQGDVLVRTHVSTRSPMVPHEPAPFIDVPVDRERLAREKWTRRWTPSCRSTPRGEPYRQARRLRDHGAVKEGYILRPTREVLDIYERVAAAPRSCCRCSPRTSLRRATVSTTSTASCSRPSCRSYLT